MAIYGETYSKFKANDLIENNYFNTDTWWGKQVNVTIADGVSHYTATPAGNGLYRLSLLTIGLTYTITFTILNFVSGGIRIWAGEYFPTVLTGNGNHTLDFVASGNDLYITSNGTSTLDIDNVFVTNEVIDLRYSTIEPNWGNELLIRNKSVFTAETAFTKIANDFASFIVTVNIWKNGDPGDAMNELLPYNHTIVQFMLHNDSDLYVQKIGGGDALFYIESMTPVYIKNEPPILNDKLIIKFVSLEAVDTSGSIF